MELPGVTFPMTTSAACDQLFHFRLDFYTSICKVTQGNIDMHLSFQYSELVLPEGLGGVGGRSA